MTGQDIRLYRKKAGLTQKQLAAAIGVGYNKMGDWELGRRSIPPEYMAKIEAVLGVCSTRTTPASVPAAPKTSVQDAKTCKACPYWRHMDGAESATMYCAHLQEVGRWRSCGVERTYQRYRALSPLSLDAARAAELGMSYGQYKAMEVI